MPEICPDCKKELKNKSSLRAHRAKFHKPIAPEDLPPDDTDDDDDDEFTIETDDDQIDDTTYYCHNCGHEPIRRGAQQCPSCGVALNWQGII